MGYSGQQPLVVHTSRSDRGAKCVGRANTRAKDRRFIARIDHRGQTASRARAYRAHRETNKKHIRCANQVFCARACSLFLFARFSLPARRCDCSDVSLSQIAREIILYPLNARRASTGTSIRYKRTELSQFKERLIFKRSLSKKRNG